MTVALFNGPAGDPASENGANNKNGYELAIYPRYDARAVLKSSSSSVSMNISHHHLCPSYRRRVP